MRNKGGGGGYSRSSALLLDMTLRWKERIQSMKLTWLPRIHISRWKLVRN